MLFVRHEYVMFWLPLNFLANCVWIGEGKSEEIGSGENAWRAGKKERNVNL